MRFGQGGQGVGRSRWVGLGLKRGISSSHMIDDSVRLRFMNGECNCNWQQTMSYDASCTICTHSTHESMQDRR